MNIDSVQGSDFWEKIINKGIQQTSQLTENFYTTVQRQ